MQRGIVSNPPNFKLEKPASGGYIKDDRHEALLRLADPGTGSTISSILAGVGDPPHHLSSYATLCADVGSDDAVCPVTGPAACHPSRTVVPLNRFRGGRDVFV